MDEIGTDMGETADPYELDELLGAYALDAVDADERRRVEDYLRINPRAAAEVQAHREVATMLAFTGMDAPADLWSKITAEIEAEAPSPGPELARVFAFDPPEPESVVQDTSPPTPETRGRQRQRIGTWIVGTAAAVALAVGGAIVVVGTEDTTSNDPIAEAYDRAIDDGESMQAQLVADGSTAVAFGVIDQDGRGYVDAAALPRLSSEQTYQLWGVLDDNGDVVSLGILGRDPEVATFTVEADVAALAITIEQSPGVISDGNPDGAFVGELSQRTG